MPYRFDPDTQQQPTDDFYRLLEQYAAQGRLKELFEPYAQQGQVLDEQLAMGKALSAEPATPHTSPWGAILGSVAHGIDDVSGAYMQGSALKGQKELGERQQSDAALRMQALLDALSQRGGTSQGLNPTPSDAELLSLFSGE